MRQHGHLLLISVARVNKIFQTYIELSSDNCCKSDIDFNKDQKYYYERTGSTPDMTNEDWLGIPSVKEVDLQTVKGDQVQCGVCAHHCIIKEGKRGICQCRTNIGGKLYTLTYGDISALESRPIEIKPFYHFWPGSTALTFSTWGCNLKCPWCQNHHLSKNPPEPGEGYFIPPERVVERALKNGDQGLCVSFNEPLMLFEYCTDLFPLARKRGLYNSFVSNGYMTIEALEKLNEAGLDAIKIDVKGGAEAYKRYCKADESVIWRSARAAKDMGMHVEIVNLVIPTVNVNTLEELIQKHLELLGPDTPLHFTRYHPDHEFHEPGPEVRTLEEAVQMAKDAGIRFPYVGNLSGHRAENTWCPECDSLLIERGGHSVSSYNIKDGKCPECGEKIPVTGQPPVL